MFVKVVRAYSNKKIYISKYIFLPAAMAGPRIVATMRESASYEAMQDLASKIDDEAFFKAFASGKDQLQLLMEQNTVTISRLMELVPPGTPDPTPFLYDNTMFVMAGIQTCAFLTNQFMQPVDPSKHEGVKVFEDQHSGDESS